MKECIALREGFDPSGGPEFAGLKTSHEFTDLVEKVHRDFPVVAQARLGLVFGFVRVWGRRVQRNLHAQFVASLPPVYPGRTLPGNASGSTLVRATLPAIAV